MAKMGRIVALSLTILSVVASCVATKEETAEQKQSGEVDRHRKLSNCFQERLGEKGCGSSDCEAKICACDPYCCSVSWDSSCVGDTNNYFVPGCTAIDLCQSTEDPESGCTGAEVAAPSGVQVFEFSYGGNRCPASLNDPNTSLTMINNGAAVELNLPPNIPPIAADATSRSTLRAICMLSFSFQNVPSGMCWSPGTTTQAGQATVPNSATGSQIRVNSRFAFGPEHEQKEDLTITEPFIVQTDEDDAVCNTPGDGNIYHFDSVVTARKGSVISLEHIQ
eukprot:138736_1